MKYKQNLKVEGNNVYSYGTHVATIRGKELVKHGYWSQTTSKHINHVSDEYGLQVVDGGREDTPTPQEQVKNSPFGLASLVASFAEIFSETPQQKNDWKKRMLATQKGITFPDNWDTLSEEEKQKRLDEAIAIGRGKI